MTNRIEQLTKKLLPLTAAIGNHSLYRDIISIHNLRRFMEEHVFAVWDFMCLLKVLHGRLVSTSAPWFPPTDGLSAHLIGGIVAEEESDITENGSYASHFEMYVSAMEKIGANTQPIKKFLTMLKAGKPIQEAIDLVLLNAGTKTFVLTTFRFFERPLHELAAAFVYGREGITSAMFAPILEQWQSHLDSGQQQYSTLIHYFKRHLTLDDGEHYPKALKMLENLIGNDDQKLIEAEEAAVRALKARIAFLTDIHAHLEYDMVGDKRLPKNLVSEA